MSVTNVWSGAVGPSGATVIAKVGGASARLLTATNSTLSGGTYTSAVTPSAQGIATFAVTGLAANTQYWYAVEDAGVLDTSMVGMFHTHAAVGSAFSFSFTHGTCAGDNTSYPVSSALRPNQCSNHPVFTDIAAQAPLLHLHGGDFAYYNPGNSDTTTYAPDASVGTYRRMYDDVLAGTQGALYRQVPIQYMWDNHCYGQPGDDSTSDGSFAFKTNAAQVYRERVPHYPLATGDTGTDAIYTSFQIGRVLFVSLDIRYYRDPVGNTAPRTMLGSAQITWLQGVLSSSTAAFLVVQQGQDWTNNTLGQPNWGSYSEERAQLVSMFAQYGWTNRMIMCVGDSHALAIDTGGGANASYGGFPIVCAAPMDAHLTVGPSYDLGKRGSTTGGSRGQWSLIQITDSGSWIRADINGYYWTA